MPTTPPTTNATRQSKISPTKTATNPPQIRRRHDRRGVSACFSRHDLAHERDAGAELTRQSDTREQPQHGVLRNGRHERVQQIRASNT